MTWQNTLPLAIVDAMVLVIAATAVFSLVRRRRALSFSASTVGLTCIGAGIVLFSLFYGIDFLIMAVLPHVAPADHVERVIRDYHPHNAWLIASYGMVLVVWGFLIVNRHAVDKLDEQQAVNTALQLELEARTQAEAELQETQAELQLKISSLKAASDAFERRGAELALVNAELEAARDRAEDSNRTKSEFLALMSHELRTPLNAVIGFSEMIKDETYGPVGSVKYREYATDIHASGRHLLQIINDILDLSKVEAGAEELVEESFLAGDAAKVATALVEGRASRAGITLSLQLPEQPLALMADQRKIKQVLINLLGNSVKYTNAGGQCVLSVSGDPETGLDFKICDTGIGIANEDMPMVMQKFGQVSNRHNRKLAGSGLGLPLTKSLVEMHGGTLSIESTVGIGTTATVHLPPERVLDPASIVPRNYVDFAQPSAVDDDDLDALSA